MSARRQTAIVTGASGSIGAATVGALCSFGWRVIGLGQRPERLHHLRARTGCDTIAVDLRDAHQLDVRLIDIAPDLLVHAAGILGSARKLFEVASAEAAELVNINILGTLNVLRVVVPKFLRQNHGHVIILGSIVGQYAGTGPALYGATKSAVHVMARDLRSDLFGSAIRVTEILPGRVKTGIHRQLTGTDDTGDREFYDGYACLEPDDVAASILWAVQAPAHVDVTQVEILPTHQVPGGARFWKQEG